MSKNGQKLYKIDKKIAKSLYAGIMTDTGSFKFPSTTHVTHKVVSNLLKTGISHFEIHNQIYDNNKPERIQLLSFALSQNSTFFRHAT